MRVPYLMRRGKLFEIYDLQNDLNDKVLSDPLGKGIVLARERLNVEGWILYTMLSC